ncbi:MAG: PAS domain S-box protein [Ignavibacteriaceae bacterium]|nr:PAS domain S-box protein [Ignavibacteriaceae bacterium]
MKINQHTDSHSERRFFSKKLYLVLGVIILLLISSAFVLFNIQKNRAKKEKYNELYFITNLKEQQIIQWRSERTADGLFFYSNPFFKSLVADYLKSNNKMLLKDVHGWLLPLYKNHDYLNIILFDNEGNEILRMNQNDSTLNQNDIKRIFETSQNGKVTLSSLIKDDSSDTIFMDNVVPLLINKNGSQYSPGILLFRIDPEINLFPLIQSWPVQTKTAETMLLRDKDDSFLILNELRHKKNTALNFLIQSNEEASIFNKQNLSAEGVIEGSDYRKESVIASFSAVEGTDWYIIAKIDVGESFALVYQNGIYLVIITGLLIIVISSGFWLFIKNQQSEYYEEKYNLESQKQALIKHYAYLHKYATDIIILSDYNGHIIEVNEKAISTYTYSQEEFMNLTLTDLRAPNAHSEPIVKQVKDNEEGLIFETIHKRKDGTTFYVELSSRLILVEGKHYIQAIIRDVSERKEAEKKMFDINNYLTTLIDSSPIAIYDLDGNGVVKSIWNKTAEKIFGWQKEEVIGKRLPSIAEENWSEFEKLKAHIKAGEVISNIELERKRKNGEKFYVSLFIAPIFDESHKVSGAISMASDITKRREAEEELRRLTSELEERVVERTSQLEELNKELEAFSYSISHDLRAPLRHILSFLELAKLELPERVSDELVRYMSVVKESAVRMSLMIDELLEFSRKSKTDIIKSDISLNELIEKVLADMKPELQNPNVKIEVEKLPNIFADYKMIKTVFYNLIENGVKFSSKQENPIVKVGSIQNDEREIVICVEDNGVGFDSKNSDKLFGVFKRLHNENDFSGIGIGLANVKRIISRHGGKVWAESIPNQKTVFYISFPKT